MANPELKESEKRNYDTMVDQGLVKNDVIDNLTTQDMQKPLSAKQGYLLNQSKLGPSSIVDNLTSTDSTKVLSANQGKVLKSSVDQKAPLVNGRIDIKVPIVDSKGLPTQAFVALFNQLAK